ncbi:two-component sensor histidine kinase [Streptomyces kaniharaensis]|uniref:histidine kinase n=1 Tax=Streptomyces kaniharaensis TaxID=212423 RepID=A0A6N7KPZ4_9ACTN|nr:histidine kinase [Streptomyces kaniharaensis]MQS13642.1 two-component sensor histidine kinase [Streptomyces kaniharaensis]
MTHMLALVVPVAVLPAWAARTRFGLATVAGVAGAASVAVSAAVWFAGRWTESSRWPGLVGLFELAALLLLAVLTLRTEEGRRCAAATWTIGGAVALWPSRFDGVTGPDDVFTLFGFGAVLSLPAVLIGLYLRGLDEGRRRAVAEARRAQRLDLAHDLHDFVAHDVSGMVAQAQAGAYLATIDPARAVAMFERIEQAGQRALASLDRTVQLLRTEEGTGRSPQPGLAELAEVAERFTASGGAEVRLELPDEPVPREVEGTAHRIVVEALTNVRRHAPGARQVDVRARHTGGWLELTVTNDGRAPGSGGRPRRSGGSGLPGLTARVEALGGTFDAGADEGEAWRVTARLPLEGQAGLERPEIPVRTSAGERRR